MQGYESTVIATSEQMYNTPMATCHAREGDQASAGVLGIPGVTDLVPHIIVPDLVLPHEERISHSAHLGSPEAYARGASLPPQPVRE
jgi:hypothetical protein